MKQNGQMQSERAAFFSNKKSGQMPLLSIHFVPNTRCEYLQSRITIIVKANEKGNSRISNKEIWSCPLKWVNTNPYNDS